MGVVRLTMVLAAGAGALRLEGSVWNRESHRAWKGVRVRKVPPLPLGPAPHNLLSRLRMAGKQQADDGGLGETLDAAAAALEEQQNRPAVDAASRRARGLWRIGWLSWWTQLILSVVSAVVLMFARAVIPNAKARIDPLLGGGILFSSLGLCASFVSVVWSWHYTRLSRRDVTLERVRSALRFGVIVNITGMLLTLVSAEQIVGGLIAKLLLTPGSLAQLSAAQPAFRPPVSPVTALDVFIVQANTNTLASHLAGLVASLFLLSRSRKW